MINENDPIWLRLATMDLVNHCFAAIIFAELSKQKPDPAAWRRSTGDFLLSMIDTHEENTRDLMPGGSAHHEEARQAVDRLLKDADRIARKK
ncbi:hypothetical protein [Bradyrhizobium sp. JYMT SZCCT0428]|uniref:hypothetical protein n=1 Tax=Bradyrhizobium sp. JYMT SZCCT0428 TaxID=2807673 RepID=UPI001BA728E7|nr:hypothetical protein [Bradyrhizobium sp. JYMT SZCCT0428]MBR1157345.1 hypothetical protein [Bradyrhizobium sp. JYMT SZCCT0428]